MSLSYIRLYQNTRERYKDSKKLKEKIEMHKYHKKCHIIKTDKKKNSLHRRQTKTMIEKKSKIRSKRMSFNKKLMKSRRRKQC